MGSDGKLSDADLDNLGARVERIVMVGLRSVPKRVAVEGRELEVTGEKVDGGVYKVTVKDPKVWIGREWEVAFK